MNLTKPYTQLAAVSHHTSELNVSIKDVLKLTIYIKPLILHCIQAQNHLRITVPDPTTIQELITHSYLSG